MNKLRIIYILTVMLAMAACGTLSRPVKDSLQPADVGYKGPLEATFYYTEGIKSALLYGDPERADRLFARAIEVDSMHDPSYYEAANNLLQRDPAKALEFSLKANAIDTANVWYKGQLGQLMILNKEYSKALDLYEELVEIAPHNPDNYRLLAMLYEQNKQPFTAIVVLDSAENKLGRMEELSAYKRQLLINVQLYDKAIAESQALIRDFPYRYENYLVLAELYAQMKRDSLAMVNYDKALDLNPNGTDIIASMNDYYKRKGDNTNFLATARLLFQSDDIPVENKVRFFEDIISNRNFYRDNYFQLSTLASTLMIKYPQNYEVVDLYASNLIAYGEMEQALEIYKTYLTDTTSNIEAFNNIIDMEAYLQRSDSVEKYSTMALHLFPDNAELYLRKGGALTYLKKEKEAEETYREALKHADSDSLRSVVLGVLGDMYHQKQAKRQSYAYYEKALHLWPDNVMILNNYAYYLSEEEEKLDKALEMAERVMELTSGNPTYLDTYGWVLYKLGRYEEAKKVIQQAISLDSSASAELLVHYGDILFALNDGFMATVYWRKALEAGYDAEKIAERLKKQENK